MERGKVAQESALKFEVKGGWKKKEDDKEVGKRGEMDDDKLRWNQKKTMKH